MNNLERAKKNLGRKVTLVSNNFQEVTHYMQGVVLKIKEDTAEYIIALLETSGAIVTCEVKIADKNHILWETRQAINEEGQHIVEYKWSFYVFNEKKIPSLLDKVLYKIHTTSNRAWKSCFICAQKNDKNELNETYVLKKASTLFTTLVPKVGQQNVSLETMFDSKFVEQVKTAIKLITNPNISIYTKTNSVLKQISGLTIKISCLTTTTRGQYFLSINEDTINAWRDPFRSSNFVFKGKVYVRIDNQDISLTKFLKYYEIFRNITTEEECLSSVFQSKTNFDFDFDFKEIPDANRGSVDGVLEYCFDRLKEQNLTSLNINYCSSYFKEQLKESIKQIINFKPDTYFIDKASLQRYNFNDLEFRVILQLPSKLCNFVWKPAIDANELKSNKFTIEGTVVFNRNFNPCKPYNAYKISELINFVDIKRQEKIKIDDL